MLFPVKTLAILVILTNIYHRVTSTTNCIIDPAGDCIFAGIFTNETHPNFYPESSNRTTNITDVYVCHSQFFLLTSEICKAFPQLIRLFLENILMEKLEENSLNACPLLKVFNMPSNNVTKINPNLFINNPEITNLDFSSNQLTSLDVKLFDHIPKLTCIILRYNKLVRFDVRAMPVLPNLQSLILDCNNLLELDENAIAVKMPKLIEATVDKNLFDCRNLNLLLDVFTKKEVFTKEFKLGCNRTKGEEFTMNFEKGIQCLDREEHLNASSYYFNKNYEVHETKDNSDKQDTENDTKIYIFLTHIASTALIIFCISMMIYEGVHWKRALNAIIDKDEGDYYYGSKELTRFNKTYVNAYE